MLPYSQAEEPPWAKAASTRRAHSFLFIGEKPEPAGQPFGADPADSGQHLQHDHHAQLLHVPVGQPGGVGHDRRGHFPTRFARKVQLPLENSPDVWYTGP